VSLCISPPLTCLPYAGKTIFPAFLGPGARLPEQTLGNAEPADLGVNALDVLGVNCSTTCDTALGNPPPAGRQMRLLTMGPGTVATPTRKDGGGSVFALVVRFDVLPDHLDAFDALVSQTVAEIAAREPGTVAYVTHLRSGRPSERIFYECYEDEEAFATHEAQGHTCRFLHQRSQHLACPPEVWRLGTMVGVIAGDGIDDGSRPQG
jgi:quinol monooxygenase YgiN